MAPGSRRGAAVKPFYCYCLARSPGSVPLMQFASGPHESLGEYLIRMCDHFGGSLASVNMKLVRIEVRVVTPKPEKRKARKGAK